MLSAGAPAGYHPTMGAWPPGYAPGGFGYPVAYNGPQWYPHTSMAMFAPAGYHPVQFAGQQGPGDATPQQPQYSRVRLIRDCPPCHAVHAAVVMPILGHPRISASQAQLELLRELSCAKVLPKLCWQLRPRHSMHGCLCLRRCCRCCR